MADCRIVNQNVASSVTNIDNLATKYANAGTEFETAFKAAIAEMEGNQIWMGNGMGLWRVNTEKDILEPIAAETLHYGVRTLLPDGKGTLYIGSEAGLFIYKNGNLEQKLIDPNVLSASNIITGLSLSEDGILWIATNDGLYSLTLADKKIVPYHNIVEDKHFCSYNNITRIGNVLYLGYDGSRYYQLRYTNT